MYEIKIPKARVACLIGRKGVTKKVIENSTKTKLRISKEGDVEIYGDGYDGYICEKIVRAVGRGFNPIIALNLVQEDYSLVVLDIKDFTGKSKSKFMRIKSRLIGSKGKARKVIEKLTECSFCVYGKTASLIGEFDKLNVAFKGVEKLLMGSPHGNVYSFLEREMRKIRKEAYHR